MMYAVYKNKVYLANVRELKVRLKSRIAEPGFNELVDLAGNIHKDIFIKEVDMNNIDIIYEIDYRVLYKGNEYKCLKVTKEILDINYITIYTNDSDIADQYGFIKKEQFIYDKNIPLNEIDALIEIKKPILKFKYLKEEKTKIEQKEIKNYLVNIIE
ncbi:MAG: hypothetical protein E7214_05060 [Clostridium sp.]|nr:hypothetical protein [Clostridium sp.]